MDLLIIIYGVFIGIFAALMAYGAGKFGSTGDPNSTFNLVKGVLCAIVGGIFGGVVAYEGGTLNPDAIMQLISSFTLGGLGIIWLLDLLTQIIIGYLVPKSNLGKSMAVPRELPV